jgi:hypothetical protein
MSAGEALAVAACGIGAQPDLVRQRFQIEIRLQGSFAAREELFQQISRAGTATASRPD